MADTTKTIREKLDKLKASLVSKTKEYDTIYPVWEKRNFDFQMSYGDHKGPDDAVIANERAAVKKLYELQSKLKGEKTGLEVKIEAVEKSLAKYINEKANLRGDKAVGDIDKDEYAKRKALLKEVVKSAGTVKKSELTKLKERLKKKEAELAEAAKATEATQELYDDAKKFFLGDFVKLAESPDKIAARCLEFFGKKNANSKEAQAKVKQYETKLKDYQKEERILKDEVKQVSEKIEEGDKRLGLLEKDLARSVESMRIGGLTQAQFDKVKSDFEKTLGIK